MNSGKAAATNSEVLSISQAFELHLAGNIDEAEKVYRRILANTPDNPDALHLLGVVAYQRNNFKAAIDLIRQAVKYDSSKSDYYCNLGNALRSDGQLDKAIRSYRKAAHLSPYDPDVHNNLGVLYLDSHEPQKALQAFKQALRLKPDSAGILNNTGNAYKTLDDPDSAEDFYLKALELDAGDAEAHNNLGALYLANKKLDDAVSEINKALELNPNYDDAYNNLGNTLHHQNDIAGALQAYEKACEINPGNQTAFYNLAGLYHSEGKIEKAIETYRKVLELTPNNLSAKHILDALEGKTTSAPPDEYVKSLFNDFAQSFDKCLVDDLEYTIPEKIKQIYDKTVTEKSKKMLDLGCGTGFCGEQFRDSVEIIHGVDISEKMLDKAKEKNVYDQLFLNNITSFLMESDEVYDLIVSTDVFIYVGDLDEVFGLIKQHASENALFLFSVETSEGDSFELLNTARYAHSDNYIKALADKHGFKLITEEATDIRKDKHLWIPGKIFSLREHGGAG